MANINRDVVGRVRSLGAGPAMSRDGVVNALAQNVGASSLPDRVQRPIDPGFYPEGRPAGRPIDPGFYPEGRPAGRLVDPGFYVTPPGWVPPQRPALEGGVAGITPSPQDIPPSGIGGVAGITPSPQDIPPPQRIIRPTLDAANVPPPERPMRPGPDWAAQEQMEREQAGRGRGTIWQRLMELEERRRGAGRRGFRPEVEAGLGNIPVGPGGLRARRGPSGYST